MFIHLAVLMLMALNQYFIKQYLIINFKFKYCFKFIIITNIAITIKRLIIIVIIKGSIFVILKLYITHFYLNLPIMVKFIFFLLLFLNFINLGFILFLFLLRLIFIFQSFNQFVHYYYFLYHLFLL